MSGSARDQRASDRQARRFLEWRVRRQTTCVRGGGRREDRVKPRAFASTRQSAMGAALPAHVGENRIDDARHRLAGADAREETADRMVDGHRAGSEVAIVVLVACVCV